MKHTASPQALVRLSPRSLAVLQFCASARTMFQILQLDGEPNLTQFAVHNLVKRGLLENERKGSPRGVPGLYRTTPAGAGIAGIDVTPALSPFDATALLAAWMQRPTNLQSAQGD
jgi:hypothetical protein